MEKLNIYFHRILPKVKSKNYDTEFASLTNAFCFNGQNNYRPIDQDNGKVNLWEKKIIDGFVVGSFFYVQINEVPNKTNYLTKDSEEIELKINEGLLYCTPFLFNPSNNILIYGRNNPGVNLSSVRKFVSENFNLPSFDSLPIQKEDAYDRFNRSHDYTQLVFSVANPFKYGEEFDSENSSLGETFGYANKYDADEVKITLKSKRNKKLNSNRVKEAVNTLLNRGIQDDLKSLIVTGESVDDEKTINFLTNRLKGSIHYKLNKSKSYNFNYLYEQLVEKYNENSTFLDKFENEQN